MEKQLELEVKIEYFEKFLKAEIYSREMYDDICNFIN